MDNIIRNKEICKNIIGFSIIILIITSIFLFKFKIGFTVFENIENIVISLSVLMWLFGLIIIIIICIIFLIYYRIEYINEDEGEDETER